MRQDYGHGLPDPVGVCTLEEFGQRLRELRFWSGLNYREIHRRVLHSRRRRGIVELPAFNTVYRCLQPQRSRVDVDLVVDVVTAMLPPGASAQPWRQAHAVVCGRATDADVVAVGDLPPDPEPFVGRRREVAMLVEAVAAGATRLLVDGMPGVGKSDLAAHVAHRLLDAPPLARRDVLRLWAPLRGFDPWNAPVNPLAVLDQVLRQLGVSGSELVSLDRASRIRQFRALLLGRAGVLVLDDAASAEQVRPLLPSGPGPIVIVTSRDRLGDLPGSQRVELEPFQPGESLDALRAICGPDLVDAEPGAARRVCELAGHLPLALALVAGRMAHATGWTVGDHVEHLEDRRSRLVLDAGVDAVLGTSYAMLPPEQRELLRRVVLHPGYDFDDHAAAALVGVPRSVVRRQLTELVRAHLVQPSGPGRFRLHDVVAVFAANRARDDDSPSVRRDAVIRLGEHYAWTLGVTEARLALDQAKHHRPAPCDPGTDRPELATSTETRAWLDTERTNLLAATTAAIAAGRGDLAAGLAECWHRYFHVCCHDEEAAPCNGRCSSPASTAISAAGT